VAQGGRVRFPASLPELVVDQQPRVGLVQVEVASGLRGGRHELDLFHLCRGRSYPLFRLQR